MRRTRPDKREILPDIKYQSIVVQNLINRIMRNGKKSVATRLMYDAMDMIQERTGRDPMDVLGEAMNNVGPIMEVRPRRVGGATYQVPMEVTPERRMTLAMRWIRDFARKKKGRPMKHKLAEELLAAYKGEGAAVKKRDDTHKMAESNKAFSHLRW